MISSLPVCQQVLLNEAVPHVLAFIYTELSVRVLVQISLFDLKPKINRSISKCFLNFITNLSPLIMCYIPCCFPVGFQNHFSPIFLSISAPLVELLESISKWK